ncbi:MAG: HtaA domain-containing protein [Solirubrobacterales bacterium]
MTVSSPARALRPRFLIGAAATLLALLVLAPAALAARDPLGGGGTDYHFKKGFVRKLSNLGVTVSALGNASLTGNKLSQSYLAGKLDPTTGLGYVEQRGGFKLSLGNRGVPVTKVTVNTAKGIVYATVAKAHMELGTLSELVTSREGFGANVRTVKLTLSEKATRRISNRLGLRGPRRLNPGRVMSNSYTVAQPSTVTLLAKGSASLVGDLGTFSKFGQKGVELPGGITALAPATKPTPVSFEFPITGGTLATDATDGTVATGGGVQIVKKAEPFSPTMKLTNIQVDFKARTATVEIELLPNPPLPGTVGRSSIADVTLPAGAVKADPATRTITITGAEAKLQAVAAATLNDVFNQPAGEAPASSNFVVGDPFGKFSLVAYAR